MTLDQAFIVYPAAKAWWNSNQIVELTCGGITIWERN